MRNLINFFNKTAMNLFEKDITTENVEEFLREVIDEYKNLGIDKLDTGEQISNLYNLLETLKHGDDAHHNGETILQHTKEVLEDVIKLTAGMDENIIKLLKLTAIFHDLGKAYTFNKKIKNDVEKITFYNHAKVSLSLLEKLAQKELNEKNEMYEKLAILVRSHDEILQYLNAEQKNINYVKNLLDSKYYKAGLYSLLKLFVKADSFRAKTYSDTEMALDRIDKDIDSYQEKEKEKDAKKILQNKLIVDKKDEIIALLKNNFPQLVDLYPNISEIKKQLGDKKMFDVLKQLGEILSLK